MSLVDSSLIASSPVAKLASLTDSLVAYCCQQGYALAIWRLPMSNRQHFLVSFQPQVLQETEIEALPTGFIVAEFEKGIKGEKYFLPADVYVVVEDDLVEEASKLLQEQLPGLSFVASSTVNEVRLSFSSNTSEEKKVYEQLVQEAMHQIELGTFKKVVLARKREAHLEGTFSVGQFFERLCGKTTNTFNSITYSPAYGTWIGATPEVLVSKNADQLFKTIALAGTQRADGHSTEKEAIWSQKEIEEQAYVSRYIVERLKQIRLREFDDIGPKTVRIGNLFHLKTEFLVNLREVDFPNLLNTMLHLLHPTSAVCGMPREAAIAFVLQHEGFARELYSGYLGPVNVEGATHLFVNLRCAKIAETITFFAGAGITEDSQAEKEFQETEVKIESLLSLF